MMFSRVEKRFILLLITIVSITCYGTHITIEQCPGTEVPQIRHQVQNHEVSLIFYYTRWSTDSLDALKVYNDVAQYYSDNVYFSSIDCWHLSCNCSRTLNTALGSGLPHKWPTLVAYYGRRGQLQIMYHGLWSFYDIQQFVNNLLYPLERLRSKEELAKMRTVSDAVIVGVFDTADCIEFQQYLIASLKWLESDPLRTYHFTVAFNDSVTKISNFSREIKVPNVIFVGPSSIRSLRNGRNQVWNASHILMWLHKELKRDMNLLHGYETPITVAQKLTQQAVLTIFVSDPQRFFSYMEPYIDTKLAYSTRFKKCEMQKYKTEDDKIKRLRLQKLTNDLKIYTDDSKCYYDISALWRNLGDFYQINRRIQHLFFNLAYVPTKHQDKTISHKSSSINFYHITQCLNSDLTSSNSLQVGTAKYLQTLVEQEVQLLNSNRSMSVVLLEAERYRDYLENLKIDMHTQSMTTSFIVDKDQESIFVMEDFFDLANLKSFIHRFYSHNLMAHFKSERFQVPKLPNTFSSSNIELQNLNRQHFLNYLRNAYNQTLVVLIHSDECALCGNLQQTFVQISAALRHLSAELQFLRINALYNSLPWQFNMPSLPALLVFPRYQHGETRLFPSHLKPDIRSVFAFLLNQVSPQEQIRIAVAYCQSSMLSAKNSQSCWQFSKTLLLQHIGQHLHYWQLYDSERHIIFDHLRAFKDIGLEIQRNLRL